MATENEEIKEKPSIAELTKHAYKNFYMSDTGKLILDDICNFVEINISPRVAGGSKDETEYWCGRQDVAHHIFEQVGSSLRKEREEKYGNSDTE